MQELWVVCDKTIKREFEQKSPRLESTDNMKVTVCFGLDNCSTAHLESLAKRQKKKKNTTDKNFLFWEQKFISISKRTDWGSYGSGRRAGLGGVPASLKHTNSGSSRELSIGSTPYPRNWATESIGGSWTWEGKEPFLVTSWMWLNPCRPFPFPWCSTCAQEFGQCWDKLSQG